MLEEPIWTSLSRGFATQLIAHVHRTEPPPDILKKGMTKRSGLNFLALSRSAARLRKQPGCIHAKAMQDGSELLLQVVIRQAKRDHPLQYLSQNAEFEQDLIHYALLSQQILAGRLAQLSVVLSRHTIQRWIERGGAGDPRIDLARKLDRSMARILFGSDLFAAAEILQDSMLRDSSGDSPRFGIPAPDGSLWIGGLAGSKDNRVSHMGRSVYYRSTSVFLITYVNAGQLSDRQRSYRAGVLEHGLLQAVQSWPSMFAQERKA